MNGDHTDSYFKRLFPLWSLIFIAIISFITYLPALDSAFHLDDIPFIRDAHIENIPWHTLFSTYPTRWLVFFTFKLNALYSGNNTISYHLVNLLLHIFTAWGIALLVYTLWPSMQRKYPQSGRTLSHVWTAFFIGLIFAVHPFASQPVIYISQRLTLAWSLCAVMALLLIARAIQSRYASLPGFFCAAALFLIALACKEVAVVIPLLIIAYILIFHGIPHVRNLRWVHWLTICGVFIFILALPAVVFAHLSQWNLTIITRNLHGVGGKLYFHSENLTRLTYTLTQPKVILNYLRLCLLPVGLNIDHDIPVCLSAFSFCFIIPVILFITLFIGAFRIRKKAPLILWGLLLFFIPLIPQSSIIPSPDLMFEHRAYLSLSGLIICAAGCLDLLMRIIHHVIFHRIVFICITILPIILVYATFMRAKTWETEITLWQDAYSKSPDKQRVAINYANALFQDGEYTPAEIVITRLIHNSSNVFPKAAMLAGNIAFSQGKFDIAITNFVTAIRHYRRDVDARFNLAMTYMLSHEIPKALHHLNMIISINPNYNDAYFMRGKIYSENSETYNKAATNLVSYITRAPNGEHAEYALYLLHSLTNAPQNNSAK